MVALYWKLRMENRINNNMDNITNIYTSTGTKLRAEYTMISDSIIKTTDYCGNLIYEQGRPKMLLVEGGYVTFNDNDNANGNVSDSLQLHYYLTDHLGNNSVVVNSNYYKSRAKDRI